MPSVDPSFDWTIFDRYYARDASPEDRARLDAWLAGDSSRQAFWAAFNEIHERHAGDSVSLNVQAVLERVRRRNGVESVVRPPLKVLPVGRFKAQPLHRRLWYACTATIAVALTVLAIRHNITRHHDPQSHVPVSAYVTGNGERANITLPDGNTVALNVASRLEVPADYLSGDHTLRLMGEALFTVRHHEGTPVTVLAGTTTTRVLGTTFMVRHYATDTATTVAVREGKVTVEETVLQAGRLMRVWRAGTREERPTTPSLFSFASGLLTLNEMNVSEAIPELDRWYDTDIRLGDPALAKRGLSGQCKPGSLQDLVTILELTLDVRVVRKGRVLTLYPRS